MFRDVLQVLRVTVEVALFSAVAVATCLLVMAFR